jgi:hypothetical protein
VVERGGLLPQRPGRDIPGKETGCPLHRRLGGLGARSEWVRKIWFEPPFRLAGSETLYGLRYSGRPFCMIRALLYCSTQIVGVNTYENTQNMLAKMNRIVIDWRHLRESATCTANWRFPFRSCEMELNCETAVSHKLPTLFMK